MQNCKSINIVHMVYECYFFNQLLHCIGMTALEMMMSVLQEVKGLTKKLYFVITSSRKTSYHANFQAQCLHGLPVLT